jgi:hypothetical protein
MEKLVYVFWRRGTEPLPDGAPPWRGIVEEAFPIEAMQGASL